MSCIPLHPGLLPHAPHHPLVLHPFTPCTSLTLVLHLLYPCLFSLTPWSCTPYTSLYPCLASPYTLYPCLAPLTSPYTLVLHLSYPIIPLSCTHCASCTPFTLVLHPLAPLSYTPCTFVLHPIETLSSTPHTPCTLVVHCLYPCHAPLIPHGDLAPLTPHCSLVLHPCTPVLHRLHPCTLLLHTFQLIAPLSCTAHTLVLHPLQASASFSCTPYTLVLHPCLVSLAPKSCALVLYQLHPSC